MKKTDIEAIKNIAKAFLRQPLAESGLPTIIIHPVYSSMFQMLNHNIVNIMEDETALDELNSAYDKRIDAQENVTGVLNIIRVPYWLTFLKHIKPYLSKEDFDRLLGDVWVESENPNGDVNVPIRTSASYFKNANKKTLMTPDELKVYNELPDVIPVYRGVSPGRVEKGLSWTANKDKALWFAKRFATKGTKYVLFSGEVKKENVLAYLNRRHEDELVIYPKNVRKLKKEIFTN